MMQAEDIISPNPAMQRWASRHHLSPQTLAVLAEHGFTSLGVLRHLNPSVFIEAFQTMKLLPLGQCMLLKQALQELRGETGEATPAMGRRGGGGGEIGYEAMRGRERGRGGGEIGYEAMAGRGGGGGEIGYEAMGGRGRGGEEIGYEVMGGRGGGGEINYEVMGGRGRGGGGGEIGYEVMGGAGGGGEIGYEAMRGRGGGEIGYEVMRGRGGEGGEIGYEAMRGAGGGVEFEAAASSMYHAVTKGTPYLSNPSPDEELRFLLLGKTGSGKSTSGNTILGADLFTVGMTFQSVTDECELHSNHHMGRNIQMMDSPGLFDTKRSHEEISIDIVKAVACTHPGPHAILYVIPLGRYTDEEYAVYTRLKALFDEDLTRYLVVLFTGGDRLRPGVDNLQTMLRDIPKGLRQVLQECGHRYVLFNNMAANKQPQVEQLFRLVTGMNRSNGGKPYQCPKYKAVGQGLEEEVARRLAEVEQREAERTRYVQQLKEQTEAAQQAVQVERENFQRREAEREAAMREEDEKRERKMAEMMEAMKKQQLSLEQQREEERKLRQQMDDERRQQMAMMKAQREEEEARVKEREQQWQKMLEEQREADRKLREEMEQRYRATVKELQQQVARLSKKKHRGLLRKLKF